MAPENAYGLVEVANAGRRSKRDMAILAILAILASSNPQFSSFISRLLVNMLSTCGFSSLILAIRQK